MGLRVVRFGSRDFVTGADVLDFFRRLAAHQAVAAGREDPA
jgi:hypothetical protein